MMMSFLSTRGEFSWDHPVPDEADAVGDRFLPAFYLSRPVIDFEAEIAATGGKERMGLLRSDFSEFLDAHARAQKKRGIHVESQAVIHNFFANGYHSHGGALLHGAARKNSVRPLARPERVLLSRYICCDACVRAVIVVLLLLVDKDPSTLFILFSHP
jgi:hypothetical protein